MLIILYFFGDTPCDLASEIYYIDIVGYVHNEIHVMFYKKHRKIVFFPDLSYKIGQF